MMRRPGKSDLAELYRMAFLAAARAERLGKDYVVAQNSRTHHLGLRFIATNSGAVCGACVLEWASDTAANMLYALAHSWGVDFTPDDVDAWLDEVEEGSVVLF